MVNGNDKDHSTDLTIEDEQSDIDMTELEEVEERSDKKIKELRDKLRACEEEKRAHLEELQRAKADFLNSKRRLEEQTQREIERATNKHIEKLLPLYDSFHIAMSDQAAWEALDQTWRKGMEAVFAQLQSLFAGYQLEVIGTPGETFDVERHEAMSTVPVEEPAQHDTIVTVLQPGFIRNTSAGQVLLRPARVTVGSCSDQ